MALFSYFVVVLLAVLGAWVYQPAKRVVSIFGFRPFEAPENIHGVETIILPNLNSCEDLEYHAPSGMIYTACSEDIELARGWNPGCGSFGGRDKPASGTIVVIDPKTMKPHRLSLEGFKGPFSTHGIGLYSAPSKPDTVYIYAVNHLPNPRWTPESTTEEKAASQIEVFVHTVGSDTAKHVRSIAHPLIRTPNDIVGISETEFIVTNDYFYREGPMRFLELALFAVQSWTDTVHVRFDADTVDAVSALTSIAGNNGLNRGPGEQVVIGTAHGGRIFFVSLPGAENRTMTVSHSVSLESVVDNPNYFADPYAGLDGKDYSGYLMPGVSEAIHFAEAFIDPTYSFPMPGRVAYLPASAGMDKNADGKGLDRLIFKDDGKAVRGVTTAVMVAIDPATNEGKRQGWLFVTSIIATNMVAVKIDFETALA